LTQLCTFPLDEVTLLDFSLLSIAPEDGVDSAFRFFGDDFLDGIVVGPMGLEFGLGEDCDFEFVAWK
jgi:hypothetical protein